MYTVQAEAASEGKLPSLSEMFPHRDDEWTCDVCMVSNKVTAAECVACAAIKPRGLICVIIFCTLSKLKLYCAGCKCES